MTVGECCRRIRKNTDRENTDRGMTDLEERRQGCVHVYCGDGKGKTTAAVGLAVRAAGRGKRVLIARFLKTEDSGEVEVLRRIPGIKVLPCERTFGFVSRMTPKIREEAALYYRKQLEQACRMAPSCDMLILDEIMAACRYGMVSEAALLDFLHRRPGQLEVVLTGRDPSETILAEADYVSEICMKKHPYTRGLAAREGIEY